MPKATRKERKPTDAKGEPNLKRLNAAFLWSLVSINLAVFLSVLLSKKFPDSLTLTEQSWSHITAKDGIIAASIPILVIILTGMLNDPMKDRIVFWRWNHPLPGCRAFSKLAAKDHRVKMTVLTRKHGIPPSNPREQNELWYSIYRKHKTVRMVWEAQKVYLLTRDMASATALFLLSFPLGAALASAPIKTVGWYALALACQYVAMAVCARNRAVQFVLNVLCEESL